METLAEEVPEVDPHPKLAWIKSKARRVEASPLGKRRSRDVKDDVYLAAALGATAECIVTYDKDLLDWDRPFGTEMVRPAEFLRRVTA